MNIVLHLQDLVRGTHILKTLAFCRKSQYWSREELDAYRLKKLQKLVHFAYENVPYYHELFDSVNLLPSDITSLNDINKIPITTKEMARANQKNMIARNINLNSYKVKKGKTGGTTGMPLTLYKSTEARDFTYGAYYRWYDWMGITPTDREVRLWGDSTVLSSKKSIVKLLQNTISKSLDISSFALNEKTLPSVAQRIIDYKPVVMRGYLSAVIQLAKFFKENKLVIPTLKAINTTTETLLPIYRTLIEDTFGVKVFDQYGCGECTGIAFECNEHNGMHVNEEHCFLQILDSKDCESHEGRIIVTDFDNFAMPFIRYENGDCGIWFDEKCSCGIEHRLLKSVEGRSADVVYLKDGSAVHGVFFTDVFYELGLTDFKYFTRFQIYQEVKGSFICRLERTKNVLSEEKLLEIQTTLARFGKDVKIEILDKLENDRSGKFRYVISNIK